MVLMLPEFVLHNYAWSHVHCRLVLSLCWLHSL